MAKTKKVHKPQWTITDKPVHAFNITADDFDLSEDSRTNRFWNDLLNRMLVGEDPTREDFFLCLGLLREYSEEGTLSELHERITELEDDLNDRDNTISHLEDENDKLSNEVSTLSQSVDMSAFAKDVIK